MYQPSRMSAAATSSQSRTTEQRMSVSPSALGLLLILRSELGYEKRKLDFDPERRMIQINRLSPLANYAGLSLGDALSSPSLTSSAKTTQA
jgi:hypothetical protein